MTTSGKFSFYFDQISIVICKFRGYWYPFAEAYSQWVLAALSVERAVAISAPFFARTFLTPRMALFSVLILFVVNAVIGIPSALVYEIVPNQSFKSGMGCLPQTQTKLIAMIFVFITVFNAWTYSTIASLLVTIYLVFKILELSRQRKQLKQSRIVIPRKDINGAITVAAMSMIKILIFIPSSIIWNFYFLSPFFDIPVVVFNFLVVSGRVAFLITQVTHVWNFYWYYKRVPGFKEDILAILKCKMVFLRSTIPRDRQITRLKLANIESNPS